MGDNVRERVKERGKGGVLRGFSQGMEIEVDIDCVAVTLSGQLIPISGTLRSCALEVTIIEGQKRI